MNAEKKYVIGELDIIVKWMDYDTKLIREKLEEAGYIRSIHSINYKIRLLGTFHLSRREVKTLCTFRIPLKLQRKLDEHNKVCSICATRIAPAQARRQMYVQSV